MKKILLSLFALMVMNTAFAGGPLQWRGGIMVMPTNMWMLSEGFASLDGVTHTPQFTMNTNFGIIAGVNFTDLIGVEVNAIFGKHIMDFKLKNEIPGFESESDYTIEISKTDIPVLLKVGGMMYFEIGPQFTMIQGVEYKDDAGTEDVGEAFSSSQMFGVLGTGVGFSIPKIARIEGGLRLGYGFQDINAHNSAREIYDDKSITNFFWGLKIAAIHKF